jgi:hypothetical protein
MIVVMVVVVIVVVIVVMIVVIIVMVVMPGLDVHVPVVMPEAACGQGRCRREHHGRKDAPEEMG